jgi:phenylalanyl-tRNA synthetase alpha chain
MKKIISDITSVKKASQKALESASNSEALEKARVEFLGRKGKIAALMPQLKDLSVEEKRKVGPQLNQLKAEVEQLFSSRQQDLLEKSFEKEEEKYKDFDVTAYKTDQPRGSLHPYTHLTREVCAIFKSMGYEVIDGPEVETEEYNFDALNIPATHPARDKFDTFWIDIPGLLMRTHTSTVQIHAMKNKKPPLALIVPGRAYRYEATDASHDCMFMQLEGLVVAEKISMSHLIATLKTFLQTLFNSKKLSIRVRTGFFPFVEPGIEFDITCPFCTKGCATCKHTRWIEMLGAGLVHPNVLKACGIDSKKYTGFAFGCGLTRLAMLKYGINDIRLLHSGQVSFLEQF